MRTAACSFLFLLAGLAVSPATTVINGDFETDTNLFVAWPGYTAFTNDAGTNPDQIVGWAGDGGRGINPVVPRGGGDSPFDDTNSWNTTSFAFLQGASYIEQTVTGFSVGADYLLDLDFNARNCCGDVPIATISINGSPVASSIDLFGGAGGIPPVDGADPWYHAQIPFTADAESVVVRFASAPSDGGDATLVIDNVTIAPIPEPSSTVLVALSLLGLMARRRR